jgi:L-lysine 6-transaminase
LRITERDFWRSQQKTTGAHCRRRLTSGNLVDMVRFQRILEVIEQDKLVENAALLGKHLLEGLHQLSAKHAHFTNPRGQGLMCAIDLPNSHARDAVVAECMSQGLMILGCGDQTIRFRPALTISMSEVDLALEILSSAYSTALDRCPVATD